MPSLQETWNALFNDWQDMLHDDSDHGTAWLPLNNGHQGTAPVACAPQTPAELDALRQECRALACTNEFAINGHENRISYIVGTGHQYRVLARRGQRPPPELLQAAQCEIDCFLRENRWSQRQQELVRRCDRDGEAFLRFFVSSTGRLQVRMIEPTWVATPIEHAHRPEASWGILTERYDVETPLGYFVAGEFVSAEHVQHRRSNVDANVKRGLPLYAPVRKNLRRAEKLLRNMTAVAEIQSAIALIRKHRAGTRQGIEALAAQGATPITNGTGQSTLVRRFAPGTILDAPGSVDYEFPASQLNAASYVAVLQAELRAIASRLVMPEFMLSSDASNANYSSTLVAEGPAMRMFSRLQAELVSEDLHVMERVIQTAMTAGRLPRDTWTLLDIVAAPPSLAVRNQLQEAQRYQIELANGILSPQTWSQRVGLDYDQEQENRRKGLGTRD
jgi:hypothetical protein